VSYESLGHLVTECEWILAREDSDSSLSCQKQRAGAFVLLNQGEGTLHPGLLLRHASPPCWGLGGRLRGAFGMVGREGSWDQYLDKEEWGADRAQQRMKASCDAGRPPDPCRYPPG
jgi:hypothetical protein